MLAVISLERMYSIDCPLRHRALSLSVYKFAIVTPWILAAIVTVIKVLRDYAIIRCSIFFAIVSLSVITPLSVVTMAYCVIWNNQKSRKGNRNHIHETREAKLTKTLFIITAPSLFTWLPFCIFLVVTYFVPVQFLPLVAFYPIKLLQLSSSLVNVIIYPFKITENHEVGLTKILQSVMGLIQVAEIERGDEKDANGSLLASLHQKCLYYKLNIHSTCVHSVLRQHG